MSRIKLYNPETEVRRRLFGAAIHEIVARQHPGQTIVEPSVDVSESGVPFSLQGTEHFCLTSNNEVVYGRSYLAVSTSPEAGIIRRLSRILRLPNHFDTRFGTHRLKRVVFALAIECPRQCLDRVDHAARNLGDRGIQFEFWEAKDVRRQIIAHVGITCPAFERSHLMQLATRANFSCTLLRDVVDNSTAPTHKKEKLSPEENNPEPVGTVFISYAPDDRGFVDKLVAILDRYAARVWYDKREILVGDSITERINAALKEAIALITVVSRSALNEPWFLRELNASLARQLRASSIPILPALIENVEMPPLLADIKCADFTRSFETGFNELLAAIQGRRRTH